MESDKRPRYPEFTESNDYDLIDNLISGNQMPDINAEGRNYMRNSENMRNNGEYCEDNHNNMHYEHGGCPMPHFPMGVPLAMAYIPDHEFDNMYEPDEGLDAGTLFVGLDKPFHGRMMMEDRRNDTQQ